jgi:hypothetical protein
LYEGLCFIGSFLIFALFFGKYYKGYQTVNYSLPTIEMLRKAIFRYTPYRPKVIWLFLAILLMDAGITLNLSLDFQFLQMQVFFLVLMLISACIGLIIWRKKHKPIRDNAISLVHEIETE